MAKKKNAISSPGSRAIKKAKLAGSSPEWSIRALPVVKPPDEQGFSNLEDLSKMGLQTLLAFPWNFCHGSVIIELKNVVPKEGSIRSNLDSWSVELFAEVYGLKELLDGAVEFQVVKDSCLHEHLIPLLDKATDGYHPTTLKHPRLGPLIRFLAPILSPANPYKMSKKMVATVVDCWKGVYRVNWATFLQNVVLMEVESLVPTRTRPVYISAFVAHLYVHAKLLSEEERIEFDVAEGVWVAGDQEGHFEILDKFQDEKKEGCEHIVASGQVKVKPSSSIPNRVLQRSRGSSKKAKVKVESTIVLDGSGDGLLSSYEAVATALQTHHDSLNCYLSLMEQVTAVLGCTNEELVSVVKDLKKNGKVLARIADLEQNVVQLNLEVTRLQIERDDIQAQTAHRALQVDAFEEAVRLLQTFQALDELTTYKAALFDVAQDVGPTDERIFSSSKLSKVTALFTHRVREAGSILRESLLLARELGYQFFPKATVVEMSGGSASATVEAVSANLVVSPIVLSSPKLVDAAPPL